MTCSICGSIRKQSERFSRTLFDTQHFLHNRRLVSRSAGAIVCWAHKSFEEERTAFRQTIRDAIRFASAQFARGEITVRERDASVRRALKDWRTFLKDWNFRMKRFRAASETDTVFAPAYRSTRTSVMDFFRQARATLRQSR